jgi:hypothetical protein
MLARDEDLYKPTSKDRKADQDNGCLAAICSTWKEKLWPGGRINVAPDQTLPYPLNHHIRKICTPIPASSLLSPLSQWAVVVNQLLTFTLHPTSAHPSISIYL